MLQLPAPAASTSPSELYERLQIPTGETVGREALELVPATLVGVVLGRALGDRIAAAAYRRILVGVLAATALLLGWSIV